MERAAANEEEDRHPGMQARENIGLQTAPDGTFPYFSFGRTLNESHENRCAFPVLPACVGRGAPIRRKIQIV